jgi:WD40 repeat protein
MSSGPEDVTTIRPRAVAHSDYSGDAPVMGQQIGHFNTQINYYWPTMTDGVAPPPLAGPTGVVDSPYRGLGAFEERDAAFFFGREEAADQVLRRMSRSVQGPGLLVVSGASGAGKSSLLRAGVLPRLREAGLAVAQEASSWPCLVFTPGHSPLDELALRTALLTGSDASAIRRELKDNPAGYALTARQAALAGPSAPDGRPRISAAPGQPERRLLLVVDQFEQIFTQCTDSALRAAFITALCSAAGDRQESGGTSAALVVLGVRSDFEARCASYPELADAVQSRYLVTPMSERQLRMAITEPAKAARSQVDDELVKVLLTEVQSRQTGSAGAGMLPLLSHALDQAWRSRTGRTLTQADYERTGGIEGAVAASAERAYGRLTPDQQVAARRVFTRLTATSADGTDTADRATRFELSEGQPAGQAAAVEAVLEAFAAERLLTLAADSVEISHEALLTAWPLLRDSWLAETHADRITRTRLRGTADEWLRSGDPSYLYRGSLLQAADEIARRISIDPARNASLSQTERDFLKASDRDRRRSARWRRTAVSGLAALTVAAVAAAAGAIYVAGISARNANAATRQHDIALSRQLAAQSLADLTDPVTARRLAVAAWTVSRTAEAESAMTTLLAGQRLEGMLPVASAGVGVDAMAFSPDGTLLGTDDAHGTMRLWNAATGQPTGFPLPADASVQAGFIAFGPDGTVAIPDGGSTIRLWNAMNGMIAGPPLTADTRFYDVTGAAFSPDGKLLAAAYNDGKVRLWNPVTGRQVGSPLTVETDGFVTGVAFSPDGKLLAASGDSQGGGGDVQLWNTATRRPAGSPLAVITGTDSNVDTVAFSPDGKLLATGGIDARGRGTVRLWNPATRQPFGSPLPADSGGFGTYVAFSPDGRFLATDDGINAVRLWNPRTGRPIGSPLVATTGADGVLSDAAFSPDGKFLAATDGDGTVRLWNLTTGQPVGAPLPADTGPGGSVSAVAFNPDGGLLATGDSDGTARLWNPLSGQPVGAPLPADTRPGGSVSAVAFNPDGGLLATGDSDGMVRLWNPATRRPVGSALAAGARPGGKVSAVAFSPDGKLLAAADSDGTVRLWNTATRQPVTSPPAADLTISENYLAFSPDGKLLAVAESDGTVRLWNTATSHFVGSPLLAVTGADNYVRAVAFSPDGKLLATADNEFLDSGNQVVGTARLWNVRTGQPVGSPLPADPNGFVVGVAFSASGGLLATADSDSDLGGTVQLWDSVTRRPVGSPLPADISSDGTLYGIAFSHDGTLLATADSDSDLGGTARVWQTALFRDPYAALCTDVGPPTRAEWTKYAPGEPLPEPCV